VVASSSLLEDWRCVFQEVEGQLQQEYETSREQISSLEDQLQAEKRRRDDAEIEVSKQKQVALLHTVKTATVRD